MLVKKVMKKPIVIDKNISLARASRIMSKKNIGSLLFIKNRKVKGVLTEGDLIKNFGKNTTVTAVMSKKVITVFPKDRISKAIDIMKRNKIGVLPVVNDKKDLVGIVTAKDLLSNVSRGDAFLFE